MTCELEDACALEQLHTFKPERGAHEVVDGHIPFSQAALLSTDKSYIVMPTML